MDSTGRTVLITGTGSGIGQSAVAAFRSAGWNVAATSRRRVPSADDGVLQLQMDPARGADTEAAVERTLAAYGRIDVLVNNAGYGLLGPLEAQSRAALSEQLDVDVVGVMHLTGAVLPSMRRAGSGRIILVSSMLGRIGFPFFSAYAAAKWALEGFGESLALEVAPFGIDVVLVEPGTVRTAFFGSSLALPGRVPEAYRARFQRVLESTAGRAERGASPERIAAAMLRAAESRRPRRRIRTDRTAKGLVALHAAVPAAVYRAVVARALG